ncbi:MAG: hypothetical protein ABMA01_24130 [Chthoniobacteraceae bacterium]
MLGDGKAKRFVIEALPRTLSRRVEDQRRMLEQVGIERTNETRKGVFNGLKIWTPDIPAVKVCFVEGQREMLAKIVAVALEWKVWAPGVPLDFGDPSNPRICAPGVEIAHIRVGFKSLRRRVSSR